MARARVWCSACKGYHRPGRVTRPARACLVDEAARLARATRAAADLLTRGHSPGDLTLMAMVLSMAEFAEAVGEHLRASEQLLRPEPPMDLETRVSRSRRAG